MTQRTVSVPTIGDKPEDFDRLFGLWQQVNGDFLDVRFEFMGCKALRHNAIAFLGGLARLIEQRSGRYDFAWNTMSQKVHDSLLRTGFIDVFETPTDHDVGHAIPYREDRTPDPGGIIRYLKSMWIGRDLVHVSPLLQDAMAGTVWEIYANALEHGHSAVGIITCGQHYPRQKRLSLTVVDFGVGIPSNVRMFEHEPALPAKAALLWAFKRGNTTKANGIGRGLGLDLLKDFVRVNQGRLEVFSHEGYAVIDKDQETYHNRDILF